jgi:hypothetical protein
MSSLGKYQNVMKILLKNFSMLLDQRTPEVLARLLLVLGAEKLSSHFDELL